MKSMSILVAEFETVIVNVNENENENLGNIAGGIGSSGSGSDEQAIKQTLYFTTPNVKFGFHADLSEQFQKNVTDKILRSVENMEIRCSGFTLARIIDLTVQISTYWPLDGSSFVQTPKKLECKKAIVKVKNAHDEMCFKWASSSAIHQSD